MDTEYFNEDVYYYLITLFPLGAGSRAREHGLRRRGDGLHGGWDGPEVELIIVKCVG